MFYYYDRDRDGIEHCFEVPDKRLFEDMENRLLLITKGIGIEYPVDIVKENDVFGYRSADEYIETHNDEDFAEPICALTKGIREIGYPFIIYRDAEHVIRVCSCSEFPLRELVQGYARSSGYKVLPDWYYSDDIDIDAANRMGMNGMIRYLERDRRKAFLRFVKEYFRRRDGKRDGDDKGDGDGKGDEDK